MTLSLCGRALDGLRERVWHKVRVGKQGSSAVSRQSRLFGAVASAHRRIEGEQRGEKVSEERQEAQRHQHVVDHHHGAR